jgi:hypothetical protein
VALAVERGWLDESARTALAFAGSAALLIAGAWLHERRPLRRPRNSRLPIRLATRRPARELDLEELLGGRLLALVGGLAVIYPSAAITLRAPKSARTKKPRVTEGSSWKTQPPIWKRTRPAATRIHSHRRQTSTATAAAYAAARNRSDWASAVAPVRIGAASAPVYLASVGIVSLFQPGTVEVQEGTLTVREQGQAILSAFWSLLGLGLLWAGLRR